MSSINNEKNTKCSKTRATSSLLLESFILDTLVCMSNAIHDKQLCFTIFTKSCNIMNYKSKGYAHFEKTFNDVENASQPQHITSYADLLLSKIEKLQGVWLVYFPQHQAIINRGIMNLVIQMKTDGFASWPKTDAVHIWPWLHVIAIDVDLNSGMEEKQSFLNFIPEIILCGSCRQHYEQRLGALLKALDTTTCANALLALHSYISRENSDVNKKTNNTQQQGFVYDKGLVDLFFADKYKRAYITIKTDDVQL